MRIEVAAILVLVLLTSQASAQSNTGICNLQIMEKASSADITNLLQQGDGMLAQCYDGYTPLHVAVQAGNIDAIRLIAAAGGDLEATNDFKSTPLHVAVLAGQALAAATLLSLGADAHAVGSDDQTPMDLAVTWDEPEIYQILARYGARH